MSMSVYLPLYVWKLAWSEHTSSHLFFVLSLNWEKMGNGQQGSEKKGGKRESHLFTEVLLGLFDVRSATSGRQHGAASSRTNTPPAAQNVKASSSESLCTRAKGSRGKARRADRVQQ